MTPATTKPEPPSSKTTKPEPPSSKTTKTEPPSLKTTKPEPPPSRTAKPEPPSPKEDESGVGSLIFILVLLVGAFVAYSTTDIRGAKEVRAFFAPVVRLVRKEVAQQLPTLREKTRQVIDNAADILAGAAPACPPGTRLGTSAPAHAPEAHAGSGEHGPTERVCVDEHLVSEIDYNKCAVCEQPNSSRAERKTKRKTRRRSEFCIDGKAPTIDPLRCATWKQAEIYCASLAARLPTEEELHALPPTLTRAPREWTSATPEGDRENRVPFRCAHDQ
jgi:hypothetical protein